MTRYPNIELSPSPALPSPPYRDTAVALGSALVTIISTITSPENWDKLEHNWDKCGVWPHKIYKIIERHLLRKS